MKIGKRWTTSLLSKPERGGGDLTPPPLSPVVTYDSPEHPLGACATWKMRRKWGKCEMWQHPLGAGAKGGGVTNIGRGRDGRHIVGEISLALILDNPDWWRSLPKELNGGVMAGLPFAHHPNTLPTGLGLGLGLRAGDWLGSHPGIHYRMELTGTISTVS